MSDNGQLTTSLKRSGMQGSTGVGRTFTRRMLTEQIVSSFVRDWRRHGDHALEKVRRTQPATYVKLAVLLVPREMKVETTNTVSGLTDTQLEAMIANIQERIAARERGEKVIDVTPEPAALALPAPSKRRDPGIYDHADTALGTQASDKKRAEKRKYAKRKLAKSVDKIVD